MSYRISDIAAALGARFEGMGDLTVTGAAEPAQARADQLALAMDPRYADGLSRGQARAAVLWDGADWRALGLEAAVFAPRGRLAMARLTQVFDAGPMLDPGIHPTAIIHPEASVGEGAAIAPYVVIGAGARIGARARIAEHVSIGAGVVIGDDALILAGVRISARVTIGNRFIAQPGAVIGGDGFSFVTPVPGHVEEARATGAITAEDQASYVRINSLGAVVIGDDVEVGANSCIDRGTVADTRIGNGTKIDNLVQIGHNVKIGETCLVCGHVAIGGSTVIHDRVVLGGKAALADHLVIGANSIITGNSGVASNVPPNRVMMGYPAVPMERNVEMYKALRRLPRVIEKLVAAQKPVSKADRNE